MSIIGNPSQTTSHFCEKSHELNNTSGWNCNGRGSTCSNSNNKCSRGKGGRVAGLAAIVYNTSIQPKANTHIDIL